MSSSADPRMLDELRRLRARVPQFTGALATGADGRVLAQDTPGVDPDGLATLVATGHGAAVRLADAAGQGEFRELLVRGVYGYVATCAAGDAAVLTLLAQDRVNVGRLLLEGRRAGARIAELLDGHSAPAGRPQPAKPADPPARTAATRTRTTRAPRTTTNNARTATES